MVRLKAMCINSSIKPLVSKACTKHTCMYSCFLAGIVVSMVSCCRQVLTEKKDFSLRELLQMVNEGELDLQPQYQRGLVWDRKMASR
jgi:hypothetical protein